MALLPKVWAYAECGAGLPAKVLQPVRAENQFLRDSVERGQGTGVCKGGDGMNRSRIEWCDHTWNPITGCRHGCPYCYARRMSSRFSGDVRMNLMAKGDYSAAPAADGAGTVYELDSPMRNGAGHTLAYPFGFEPTFHRYRMGMPGELKMGNNIFVGAMSDMFGRWVPDRWLDDVFSACMQHPIHNYLFLTKNPERYMGYGVPEGHGNLWYGTSITRRAEMGRASSLPAGCRTFLSLEPLLEDLEPEGHSMVFQKAGWVIIGAETGQGKGKAAPEPEWVRKILAEADKAGIPVFMKESLLPVVGEEGMRKEFPGQLRQPKISPKMKKRLFHVCAGCKAYMKKSSMVALLARSMRGEQPKQFGFMCRGCFKEFCGGLGLDVPELAGMAEGIAAAKGGSDA